MMASSLFGFLVFENIFDAIIRHLSKLLGWSMLWCHEIKCSKLFEILLYSEYTVEFTFLILFRGPYEFGD